MEDNSNSPVLTDREKLARLLSFLDIDSNIGPGHEPKRHSSFATHGRRSLANSFDVTNIDLSTPVVSPSLFTQRLQTFYVDHLTPVTVKRGDTILFPRTPRKSAHLIGGVPISLDQAVELRTIVNGSPMHSFSKEWQKATLKFYLIDSAFPYGIETSKSGARGLTLCVQSFMLKHLIFDREYKSSVLQEANVLKPNAFERRKALAGALCEMLWQAGDRKKCCVCLKQAEPCFGPNYRYRADSITEKLHLFEFQKFDDLLNFIKRNLEEVDHGNGCILFLYSLVLSRTIHKICEELRVRPGAKVKLLSDMEEPTQGLINLALTGAATPHLHNGDILYDERGNLLPFAAVGVKTRSHIGFLYWDKGEDPDKRTEVGSMLKTPKCPVWLTLVNGMFGLLFSLNPDLVSDWRVENKFTMWYYTGLLSQVKPTILSIETRVGRPRPKTGFARREEEKKIPPLENCIMSKWYGADVKWNGTVPFV